MNSSDEAIEAAGMDGMGLIAAERRRQVEVEGWTAEHDDKHGGDALMTAARCYRQGVADGWPWAAEWWKPKDRPRDLIRAGALYLAAVESFERTGVTAWSSPRTNTASVIARCREAVHAIATEIDQWLAFIAARVRAEATAQTRHRFDAEEMLEDFATWLGATIPDTDAGDAFMARYRAEIEGALAAVRAEAVAEERQRIAAPFVELASQWKDLLATESEIMTTAQRNAWRDALAELRHALAAGSVPVATPEPVIHEVVNMRTGRVACCGRRLHDLPSIDQQACGDLRVTCPGPAATPTEPAGQHVCSETPCPAIR